MPELLPPSVAIAIATVTMRGPPRDGTDDIRHLIGVALFSVQEAAPGDFSYQLQVRVIPAGTSEAVLIDWLTQRLPAARVAIGWQLADEIVPALLEAADASSPGEARDFVDALAATVSIDAVDLADWYGGVAAPPFGAVCAASAIPTDTMADDAMLGSWAIGRRIELSALLATNVVAAWRLWARIERPDDSTPQRFAADALTHWRIDAGATQSWRNERWEP